MATMTGTGIYLVTVQLADRRALEYAGAEDEYTGWLAELGSVETALDLDMHELSETELDAYGPIWDSPSTSPEDYA